MAQKQKPDLTTIGGRLQSERLRVGMTPTIMADIGGISKEQLAGWEAAKSGASVEFMIALAQAGIDVLFVVTGKSIPQTLAGVTIDEALAMIPRIDRHRILVGLLSKEFKDCRKVTDSDGGYDAFEREPT